MESYKTAFPMFIVRSPGRIADNVALLRIGQCRVANLLRNNLRALVLDFGAINETSGFEQGGILGGDFLMLLSRTLYRRWHIGSRARG